MFFKFVCIILCPAVCVGFLFYFIFLTSWTDLVVKANDVHASYPVLNLMERACCCEQMECICLLRLLINSQLNIEA